MARIFQVSDSHLSPTTPHADENWQAVLDHVDIDAPDMVIHTGDISLNGADDIEDLRHARRQLDRLTVPWLAIPGNHDIGDVGDTIQPVNESRRDRYRDVFGDDRWSVSIDGWRLVGLDVQTLVSDMDIASEQWDWLDDKLDGTVPTALFVHRPLRPWRSDEVDDPNRYIPEPGRGRLIERVERADVRLIASGHIHQWRVVNEARTHVWAPSTWAVLPDRIQPVIGEKVVGLVEHEFGPGSRVASTARPA